MAHFAAGGKKIKTCIFYESLFVCLDDCRSEFSRIRPRLGDVPPPQEWMTSRFPANEIISGILAKVLILMKSFFKEMTSNIALL